MLNGLTFLPKQAARFGAAAATIHVLFDSPLVNTVNVIRAQIISALETDGWRVQGITPLGNTRFLATVTGSTTDDLNAVRSAFIRTLNNHGIALTLEELSDNPEAVMFVNYTPTIDPVTGAPVDPIQSQAGGGGISALNNFLKEVGGMLGFSPTSAIIGGALAGGVVLFIALRTRD